MITVAEKRIVDQETVCKTRTIVIPFGNLSGAIHQRNKKPEKPKILANEFNSYFAGMGNFISESVWK